MDWSRGAVVSGDRGSVVNLWDLHTGEKTASLKGHKGHITAVRCLGPGAENVFVSGAQDGCLRVWDVRARRCLAAISAHISPEGSGAVADILYSVPASGDLAASKLVSAGADRVVKVFDARRNFETLHRFADHKDFIYSLAVAGNVCLSGGGDGMVLAHNVDSGALLWGVGANRAAVRCIHASSTKMVVAGDDGCSMIYNFDAA
jgi:WD40 repeat protein